MDEEENSKEDKQIIVYSQKDLLRIFPFKRTKLQELLKAGALPVVKVGRSYISSEKLISQWLEDNIGREIYF